MSQPALLPFLRTLFTGEGTVLVRRGRNIVAADPSGLAPAGPFSPAADNLYDLGENGTPKRWRRLILSGYAVAASVGPTAAQQHTLPAVTADTVALLAAAQTLTNKTLTAPGFGNGSSVETATVATTTNAATTAWSKTLADDTVYELDVTVVARRTNPAAAGTSEHAVYRRRVTVSRDGAGGATVGTTDTIGTDVETTGGYGVTVDASSNDVRVRVTGASSHNLRWNVTVRIHSAAS